MPKAPAALDFDSQTTSLGELLSEGHLIEAPGYQRPYSWGPDEAGTLLESVREAMEPAPRACFLSFMVFVDRRPAPILRLAAWPRRGERQLEVVDGFQRLTTLTILFCLLRDLDAAERVTPNERLLSAIAVGRAADARARVSLSGQHEAFFHAHVRAPGATLRTDEPDEPPSQPPEQLILAVRNHLREMLADMQRADRQRLVGFLLDGCFISLVSSSDINRAHHLFMILNATGKKLASKDILKADLLGKVPPQAQTLALAQWREAEAKAGADFEALLGHIREMYGRPKGDVITGVQSIAAQIGADAFISSVLRPVTDIYDDMRGARHGGATESAEINQLLIYLSWISYSDWKPAALLWWRKNGHDPAALLWFLKRLDRLTLAIRLIGIGGSRRSARFGAVVTAIRENSDLRKAGGPLELTREELRALEHAMRALTPRNSSGAKLLMTRLTDAMAGRAESLSFNKPMTLEHVLPRTLGANNAWRESFPDMAEREVCTDSLGNMLLLTKAQNDRARNHDFARKMDVYFRTVGAPQPAVNEGLRGKTAWTASDVRTREAELYRLIDERWQFELTARTAERAQAPAPKRVLGIKRA